MKSILEEGALLTVYVLIGAIMLGVLMQYTLADNYLVNEMDDEYEVTAVSPKYTDAAGPEIEADRLIYVRKGDRFNPGRFLRKACDSEGRNLKNQVVVYCNDGVYEEGDIDTDVTGRYIIRYAVQDDNGLWAWTDSVVEVRN